jgi:PleD family two-component response regulator
MDFSPYSVLVVDDLATSKQVCELLHSAGFRSFLRADNPDTAIGLLHSDFVHLALISLQLESNGFELIQNIRRTLPDPKRRMPILAVSSVCDAGTVLGARKAGANHFLARPYTMQSPQGHRTGVARSSRLHRRAKLCRARPAGSFRPQLPWQRATRQRSRRSGRDVVSATSDIAPLTYCQ